MTPELIGILAMSATLAGLIVAIWRDGRTHTDRGLAELRADNQRLRAEVRADMQTFREEVRADNRALRAEVHADNQRLRQDVQALAERTARLEGAIQGLAATQNDPNRHTDAA